MEAKEILCHECGITLRPFMKVCPRCGVVRHGATELTLPPPAPPERMESLTPTLSPAASRPDPVYLSPPDTVRRFPRFTAAQLTLLAIGILLLLVGGVIAWLLWRQEVRERQQFNLPSSGGLAAPSNGVVAQPDPAGGPGGNGANSDPGAATETLATDDDQRLAESVRATLAAYNPFGYTRYRYQVAKGVVTIEGEADHQPEKEGAGNVLRLVNGIRGVVNRLTVRKESGPSPLRINDAEARVLEAALRRHLEAQEQSASLDPPANPAAASPAAVEAEREAERLRRELAALRQRADELARRQAAEERLRREAEESLRQQEELRRLEAERRKETILARREPTALRAGTVAWSGIVDGVDEVILSGNSATIRHLEGQPPRDVRVSFSTPLPGAPTRVALVATDARGEIRIVQTPQPENGYTTIVRLDDRRKSGERSYQFTLRWEIPPETER